MEMLENINVALQPLIKWPGGKSRILSKLKPFLPIRFYRYVEPFVGGGALFFHLNHRPSAINDINENLITFYRLIQEGNQDFRQMLEYIAQNWDNLDIKLPLEHTLIANYERLKLSNQDDLRRDINNIIDSYRRNFRGFLINNWDSFKENIVNSLVSKIIELKKRLEAQIRSYKHLYFEDEIIAQLQTAKRAGFYYFFRELLNREGLRNEDLILYMASYVFVREFCFGSMFRYNKNGAFNIPYGGKAYNTKKFLKKVKYYFSPQVRRLLQATEIYNEDFETFLNQININRHDFMFVDPPYISEFSEYEKIEFTIDDHVRLSNILRHIDCSFLLIVERNQFTLDIYSNLPGKYIEIQGSYSYSARGRNDKNVIYLIVAKIH